MCLLRSFIKYPRLYFMLLFSLALAGCASPASYQDPIIKFQKASVLVIDGARTEYLIANKRARNDAIDDLVKKGEWIDLDVLEGEKYSVVSPEALKIRLDALAALTKYGKLLLELSSADAASKVGQSADALNYAAKSLESKVAAAKGAEVSEEFKTKADAFTRIAKIVAGHVLDKKTTLALDAAITSSGDSVDNLISMIEADLAGLYESKLTSAREARRVVLQTYNCQSKAAAKKPGGGCLKPGPVLNQDQLAKEVQKIKSSEDDWDSFLLISSSPGIESMRDAHTALVEYAKSKKEPKNLSQLVEAMDAFLTSAIVVAEAVRVIQEDSK